MQIDYTYALPFINNGALDEPNYKVNTLTFFVLNLCRCDLVQSEVFWLTFVIVFPVILYYYYLLFASHLWEWYYDNDDDDDDDDCKAEDEFIDDALHEECVVVRSA